MRIIAGLAVIAFIVSIIVTVLSAHVYKFEVIMLDCTILLWVFVAWVESEIIRRRP